jgi:hypothetical protein
MTTRRLQLKDSRITVRDLFNYFIGRQYLLSDTKPTLKITILELWTCHNAAEALEILLGIDRPKQSIFRVNCKDGRVSDGLVGCEEYRVREEDNVIVSRTYDFMDVWKPSELKFGDILRNDWHFAITDSVIVSDMSCRVCDLKFTVVDEGYCAEMECTKAEWINQNWVDVEVV